MNDIQGIRLNKFISDSGYCSRREADRLVAEHCVALNGRTASVGTKVLPGDVVTVNGKRIRNSAEDKADRIYIAYHKPVGITCTTLETVEGNIVAAVNHPKRVFPIGRLDKPSEGLIFLTSDGDIVNKILRAENAHDKEYIVTVDKPLNAQFVEKMSSGIPILNTVTKPCRVAIESRFVFKIILTQGLNRQIRRMCEYLGYRVTRLIRSRIMNVSLDNLKVGQWRNLTAAEMTEINQAVAGSSKTAKVATPRNPNLTQTKSGNVHAGKANKPQPSKSKSSQSKPSQSKPSSNKPAKPNQSGKRPSPHTKPSKSSKAPKSTKRRSR